MILIFQVTLSVPFAIMIAKMSDLPCIKTEALSKIIRPWKQ